MSMNVNGIPVNISLSDRGFALSVNHSFWGYFATTEIAVNAAVVVLQGAK